MTRARPGRSVVTVRALLLAAACVLAGCGVISAGAKSSGNPARSDAQRLLAGLRLPPGAVQTPHEPAGGGAELANSPGGPAFPHLVDLVEYWTAPGYPAGVLAWVAKHPPAGGRPGDSGSDSSTMFWTSFDFPNVPLRLSARYLSVVAVQLRPNLVGIRVDADSAALPKLPGDGRGPGSIRIVEPGGAPPAGGGSYGFEVRCDPPGGTVPDPGHVCAAIRSDPELLYSFPGPDHSCLADGLNVVLSGTWEGRPLHSSFSVCTGGQEAQAERWAALLPGLRGWARPADAIGLLRLGQPEAGVVDMLRGWSAGPTSCATCTLSFAGGWRIAFAGFRAARIENDAPEQVVSVAPLSFSTLGWRALRQRLHTWTARECGTLHELTSMSRGAATAAVYGRGGFLRLVVTSPPARCV